MKRLWIALVGAALVVGVAVAPAGAAKGTPKIQSVQGTYSGEMTTTIFCDEDDQVTGFNVSATNVLVNASTLGKGTMDWSSFPILFGGGGGPGGTWTYQASNRTSTLSGVGYEFVDQSQDPWTSQLVFVVNSGTGKFAGVTGGRLQTLPVDVQPSGPNCNISDTDPISGTIYGQLIY